MFVLYMNVLFIDFIKWNENNANFGDFYRYCNFCTPINKTSATFFQEVSIKT
jgi:hypothetical protein